ncbi:MAG: putative synthase protein [Marmoricola sp.]|nr:putative synthase protein [Marmoricola sp.]
MTTNPAPQERTPRVLLTAALAVLASTLVVALVGALANGRTGAVSAVLGGAVVLVFFAFGAVVVSTASSVMPQTALMIAMLTYTFQVALVGLIFAGLTKSNAFEADLSAGWLAGGLIVGTFAWMTGQLVATLRTPILPWEGPVAGPEGDESDMRRAVPPAGQEVDAA